MNKRYVKQGFDDPLFEFENDFITEEVDNNHDPIIGTEKKLRILPNKGTVGNPSAVAIIGDKIKTTDEALEFISATTSWINIDYSAYTPANTNFSIGEIENIVITEVGVSGGAIFRTDINFNFHPSFSNGALYVELLDGKASYRFIDFATNKVAYWTNDGTLYPATIISETNFPYLDLAPNQEVEELKRKTTNIDFDNISTTKISGTLSKENGKITNLANGTDNADAVNLGQLNTKVKQTEYDNFVVAQTANNDNQQGEIDTIQTGLNQIGQIILDSPNSGRLIFDSIANIPIPNTNENIINLSAATLKEDDPANTLEFIPARNTIKVFTDATVNIPYNYDVLHTSGTTTNNTIRLRRMVGATPNLLTDPIEDQTQDTINVPNGSNQLLSGSVQIITGVPNAEYYLTFQFSATNITNTRYTTMFQTEFAGTGTGISASQVIKDNTLSDGTTAQAGFDVLGKVSEMIATGITLKDKINNIWNKLSGFNNTNKGASLGEYQYDASGNPTITDSTGNSILGLLTTGINAFGKKITAVAEPTNLSDAATKNYVDTEIADVVNPNITTVFSGKNYSAGTIPEVAGRDFFGEDFRFFELSVVGGTVKFNGVITRDNLFQGTVIAGTPPSINIYHIQVLSTGVINRNSALIHIANGSRGSLGVVDLETMTVWK